jgi:hypothetical protein
MGDNQSSILEFLCDSDFRPGSVLPSSKVRYRKKAKSPLCLPFWRFSLNAHFTSAMDRSCPHLKAPTAGEVLAKLSIYALLCGFMRSDPVTNLA